MTRDKDPECRGILLGETDAALCVAKDRNSERHWIPRKQVGYLRRVKREDGGVDVVLTLPEWLLEKENAWDLVP